MLRTLPNIFAITFAAKLTFSNRQQAICGSYVPAPCSLLFPPHRFLSSLGMTEPFTLLHAPCSLPPSPGFHSIIECIPFNWDKAGIFNQAGQVIGAHCWFLVFGSCHRIDLCSIVYCTVYIIHSKRK